MATAVFLIISLIYVSDMLILVPKYTACKYDHTPRKKKLIWKGVCIAIPLLLLLIGTAVMFLNGLGTPVLLLLCAGMILCALGDIVLEIRFVRGGFLFGFGHLVYITAIIFQLDRFPGESVVCYLILAVMGTALTIKHLTRKYRVLMIAYNLVVSASFALAIPLIISGKPAAALMGCGAMSLVVSDWLLARNKLFGSTYAWSLISLIFYFGGQMMISAYPFLM